MTISGISTGSLVSTTGLTSNLTYVTYAKENAVCRKRVVVNATTLTIMKREPHSVRQSISVCECTSGSQQKEGLWAIAKTMACRGDKSVPARVRILSRVGWARLVVLVV